MGIEVVTISLTDSTGTIDPTGATVTITNTDLENVTLLSTTWQGEPIIANISTNTNYTVSVSAVSGVQPSSQSYKAGWKTARSITFDYNIGVFIESTDHQLYRAAQWPSAGKTANAVVVISKTHSIRMALTQVTKAIHSSNDNSYPDYNPIKDLNTAKANFNGDGTTANIIAFNKAKGTNNTTYLAPYCVNFTFPDNVTKAHVPTVGEMTILYQNKTDVEACLSACGGISMNSTYYKTSDNKTGIWGYTLHWGNGTYYDYNLVDDTIPCRPCANYE